MDLEILSLVTKSQHSNDTESIDVISRKLRLVYIFICVKLPYFGIPYQRVLNNTSQYQYEFIIHLHSHIVSLTHESVINIFFGDI